jgi:hypothetical protein
MRIYEVTLDHDTNDKFKVATHDGDAFPLVYEWAEKKAKDTHAQICSEVSAKEAKDIEPIGIDTIEYLYHVEGVAGLKVQTI